MVEEIFALIPPIGDTKPEWKQTATQKLNDDTEALLFSCKEKETDAIVIQKNGELLASGWIQNLTDLVNGNEKESILIADGKEQDLVQILYKFEFGSEKIRKAFNDTNAYGIKILIAAGLMGAAIVFFFIFGCLLSGTGMQRMPAILTSAVALAILVTTFGITRRQKMIQEYRKKRLHEIVDEILLSKIYIEAAEKFEEKATEFLK